MDNEDDIVRSLAARFRKRSPGVRLGIGDDAAVVRLKGSAEDLVVTTDMLVEDVDFRRAWMRPGQLGHKSLAVNLSDLAAMGARPRFYLVALALPRGVGDSWIRAFYAGMKRLGDATGAELLGGDLSGSPSGLQITITVLGATRGRRYLARSGGRPGEPIFVTGTLGRAAAGLKLLQQGTLKGRSRAEREALAAHRTPSPRCDAGQWLAASGLVSSMMDLSDGLSADLPRLCAASGTGAVVEAGSLPLFSQSRRWGCDPLALALHGGEDFELLFTVPTAKVERLQKTYPAGFPTPTAVGRLVAGHKVEWMTQAGRKPETLPNLGFDHFRIPPESSNPSGPSLV